MSHIVIRTDGESLTIESNRLLAVAAGLSLIEIFAKRAIAVPRFLILNLLPRQKIVDFLALPGDFYFLLSKLFCLFFQGFRTTADKQHGRNKASRHQAKRAPRYFAFHAAISRWLVFASSNYHGRDPCGSCERAVGNS